ncbi:MAG: hypothetical protein JXP37_07210 [Coriobacteriia bacterium]|nr:hypothetical protein [Coriobacteriia bacterium]
MRIRNDEGMTLIEIVVAAVILFIILTGVLSLLTQTTMISAQAKGINVANNAVNSYVEWVRSLDFAEVDLSSESSAGVLADYSVVAEGYTIEIIPTVTAGENDSLKDVVLQVTVTRADGDSESFETIVIIRNQDQYLTVAKRDPATDPVVSFVSPTPPEGAVLWETYWLDGEETRPLQIAATAEASEGRTIATASIWADDQWKLKDSFGNLAEWIVGEETWTLSPYFAWNTLQFDEGVDADGNPYTVTQVPDGLRTVFCYARDSADIAVYASRQFLVDNDAPPAPVSVTHVAGASMAGALGWSQVYDGTTSAHGYRLQLARQGATATSDAYPFDDGSGWVMDQTDLAVTSVTPGEVPLARYFARVRAFSPRPLWSDFTDMSVPFVTRPMLDGTYTVSRAQKSWTITPNLTTTPPTFPVSGTVSYKWYRVSGATETLLATTATPSLAGEAMIKSTHPANATTANYPVYYFRLKVVLTPAGYGGGQVLELTSNTVSTPYVADNGTFGFTEGTW